MVPTILLALSAALPFVAAVPMPGAVKRDIYTNTVTEIEWVTIEETTTVWVEPGFQTPAPAPAVALTTSVAPAVFAEATYSSSTTTPAPIVGAPSSSTTSAAAAYTPPPAQAPAAAAAAPAAPAPAAQAPPAAAAPAPAAAPSQSMTTQSSRGVTVGTDGTCEGSGDACVGDVTHWDGGLGACGWNVDTNSDYEIALPYEFMGTLSNSNPYCGRSVTLVNPTSGTTVQATVGDKCMGCVDRAIDCTDVLFNAITDGTGDGRVSGIEWYLN